MTCCDPRSCRSRCHILCHYSSSPARGTGACDNPLPSGPGVQIGPSVVLVCALRVITESDGWPRERSLGAGVWTRVGGRQAERRGLTQGSRSEGGDLGNGTTVGGGSCSRTALLNSGCTATPPSIWAFLSTSMFPATSKGGVLGPPVPGP